MKGEYTERNILVNGRIDLSCMPESVREVFVTALRQEMEDTAGETGEAAIGDKVNREKNVSG